MCKEEGVGLIYLLWYFVGKEDIYMNDGLYLNGKGASMEQVASI